jgi:hypothetical protein
MFSFFEPSMQEGEAKEYYWLVKRLFPLSAAGCFVPAFHRSASFLLSRQAHSNYLDIEFS